MAEEKYYAARDVLDHCILSEAESRRCLEPDWNRVISLPPDQQVAARMAYSALHDQVEIWHNMAILAAQIDTIERAVRRVSTQKGAAAVVEGRIGHLRRTGHSV